MEYRLPRPLSHSSISMYQECPQKYKFKYIDGIPERPRHFFAFGQSVHTALEFFYSVKEAVPPSFQDVLTHYASKWVKVGYKDEAHEQEHFELGKKILAGFYKKHSKDFHVPFFVEYSFTLEVDGVPVTGKVDRVDRMPDGRLGILDYKTGKPFAKGRELTDAQLTMYQLACETLLGAEVAKLTLYHLPTLKELSVSRHQGELVGALKERIVRTAEGITLQRFAPKPEDTHCRWCDYKTLCPIFKGVPMEDPGVKADDDLGAMIDKYGDLDRRMKDLQQEAEALKGEIVARLRQKGYVRAFGKSFEISRAGAERWEFLDKKRVLELIKKAGLYDRILAPSAPLVNQLMADPELEPSVRADLHGLGKKVEAADLKVKPL